MMSTAFPKSAVVFPGCTLAVLVNALAIFDHGSFPYDQWDPETYGELDGSTYTYNGTDGNHAAVTFRRGRLVATLFDHDSDRSPFRCEGAYDVERFLRGLPASHRRLAERCLGYWHAEGPRGEDVPLVTAAFWDGGESLAAAEPWEQVWEHGAHLLRRQLLEDLDEALIEWQHGTGLGPDRIAFARSVFQRKMACPDAVLVLEPEDVAYLMAIAGEGPEEYEEGTMKWFMKAFAALELHGNPFREGCKALDSIGIQLPPSIHAFVVHGNEGGRLTGPDGRNRGHS